jgi:membrane associated rhomboid family serine protease
MPCRLTNARNYLVSCAVGLSGAIFGLIVIETACSNVQTRSIFGLFTVPARLYPWALLVFWQLIMPGVSFLGHLGGVLAGQAHVWGWLKWAFPSTAAFQAWQAVPSLKAPTTVLRHTDQSEQAMVTTICISVPM